jgi:hypothetical protein
MLNFTVAMTLKNVIFWFLLVVPLIVIPASAEPPQISSPKQGSVLQGVVAINGSIDSAGFKSAEISFGYDPDPTNTWFLIQQLPQWVKLGSLATWDTTTITDGTYRVRILVNLEGGVTQQAIIIGLRVRNYTAVETSTPAVLRTPVPASTLAASPSQTAFAPMDVMTTPTLRLTPTLLPENPARVTQFGLAFSWLQGSIYALVFFSFIGVYFWIRSLIRRR